MKKTSFYDIRPKHNVEKEITIKFIRQHPEKSGIVVLQKKSGGDCKTLQVNGINTSYHAGLDSKTRVG